MRLSLPHEGGAGVEGVGAAPVDLPELNLDTWSGLEASSGVARVTAATAEQFVPQMVNLELVGGVNFQKGCYPGQEVVARSQYRGTLKRRAQVVLAGAALQAGQEVFHDADPGQPAGMVVLAGSLPGQGHVALVELLADRRYQSLMIEAGSKVNGAALDSGVVDKIFFYYAPKIFGGLQSLPVVGGRGRRRRSDAMLFRDVRLHPMSQGEFAVEAWVARGERI